MNKKYTTVKGINLDQVLAAGIQLSPEQIRAWSYQWGFFDFVDWPGDVNFRHYCHKNVITPKLEEKGFITEAKPAKTYRIGQLFQGGSNIVMLAQVGRGECVLISLQNGNRWQDPIKVKDVDRITAEELAKMCGEGRFLRPSTLKEISTYTI